MTRTVLRRSAILLALALMASFFGNAQAQSPPSSWEWLLGTWHGVGSGQPGKGSGDFTFASDLGGKIIVRKAHSEYPATDSKPATVHDDLMIVYGTGDGPPSKAIYFDNEGHTINYTMTYGEEQIVLHSVPEPGRPFFRLTYTLENQETVRTTFEFSQDGTTYSSYVEGESRKIH